MRNLHASLSVLLVGICFFSCKADDTAWGGGSTNTSDPPARDTGPFGTDTADTGAEDTGSDSDSGDTSASSHTGDSGTDTGPGITGTGYGAGDVAYNLVASNQDDDIWRLYSHYGSPVVLVFGDAYEGNFQFICDFLDDLQEKFAGDGVVFAVGLVLGPDGGPADVDAAEVLATAYDLDTVLVIEDASDQVNWASSRPIVYVLDSSLTISKIGNNIVYEAELDSWIDDVL